MVCFPSQEGVYPRVNGDTLSRFVGQRVAMVGQVRGAEGGRIVVIASDARPVYIVPHASSMGIDSGFIEVVGIVNSDLSVQEEKRGSFGHTFDLEAYNKLVALSQGAFAHLFARA